MEQHKQLDELINKLLNAGLSRDEEQRLETLLLEGGAEAREVYFRYIDVELGIVGEAERKRVEAEIPAAADLDPRFSETGENRRGLRQISGRWGFAAVTALAACIAVAVSLSKPEQDKPRQVADNGGPMAGQPGGERMAPAASDDAAVARPAESPRSFIAELGAVSADVQWASGAEPSEFLLRLKRGDAIEINAGFVAVEYYAGASLVLRGPCRLEVTGPQSGRLDRGAVTGDVSVGDFVLTTPTAKLVDLGTAFGAEVRADNSTDIRVLEGRVRLTGADENGARSETTILLTDGMTARTLPGGDIDTRAEIHLDRFELDSPVPPSLRELDKLSLVDVVNGFDSGGYRIAAAIAPDTGDPYQRALPDQAAFPRRGRGVYHVSSWHPFIDGIFVPPRTGRGVQIDSTGAIVDLPPNGAATSGPVWSRRRIADPSGVICHRDFWGLNTLRSVLQRLQACEWGLIGLHANVGITIDLSEVTKRLGRRPTRFTTTVANLDNSYDNPEGYVIDTLERRFVADFRLFIDGKLQRSRLGFGRTDGDMVISTPIAPDSRFLTVATTDAAHYWYDQVVMIDPYLELAPEGSTSDEPTPASRLR